MLFEFITLNREEIIKRCRAKVAMRSMPLPSETEINHGVPLFLDQLVEMLQSGAGTGAIDTSAGQHGHDLFLREFTVSQVVHDYGDVCQTVTGLAVETNAPISTEDFRTLNRCLDEAIASAVTIYESDSNQAHANLVTVRDSEHMGFFVHELRNLVNTATVAFEVLQSGNVGVWGSTAAVLSRSLTALRDLATRSVGAVRSTQAAQQHRKQVVVSHLIEQIGSACALEATARELTFVVSPVPEDLTIHVEQGVVTAVIGNLIQNAFKFTRAHSTVTLSVRASADRVLIEVRDECGGLPGQRADKELAASFEQRGADRSGLGIGLTFSRWATEASGGRLYARSLPGTGCIFTLDLPRSSVPAASLPV